MYSKKETIIKIRLSNSHRWDNDIKKTLHEALPYLIPEFSSVSFYDNRVIKIASFQSRINEKDLSKKISDFTTKIAKSYRKTTARLLKEHSRTIDTGLTDPFDDLKNTRQIVPTGRGKFVYSGDFLKVFFSLDRCIKKFALEIGCKEELYPTTVRSSSLINSGYLQLHPQFAYFVAPAHLDLVSLEKLTRKTILNRSERLETVANLGIPDQILSPTVCYHTFEARTNETLVSKQLVTALNKCYRHEPVNVQTLERLTTYWMREIIVFGDKKEVDRILSLAVDWTIEFLKKLGLGFSLMTASDPFFGSSGSSNRLLQSTLELKRELIMPLSGNRNVAVASFNNHQQSLTKKFSIQFSKNSRTETPESGCIGWGYERLLYAIFSQLGTKIVDWPNKSKKILGI